MPRPRPPYMHLERARKGAAIWYVRKGRGERTRINSAFGTPEFMEEYTAAITRTPARRAKEPTGSLEWLISRYRESAAWLKLSKATRYQRDNIFMPVIASAGSEPFNEITRKHIAEAMDRRRETPFAAANFVKTMRGLFKWAVDMEHLESDPTTAVKTTTPKTDGFHAWSEDEIARYEARWPVGTRERLALALFLYTGLRRGDIARFGPQHVREGVISIRAEKTGADIIIPMMPELSEIIGKTRTGTSVYLSGTRGEPMTKESLGNWFKDACKAAGVPGSAHGLRKAGATRAANNGATVAQLEAIFGWSGGNMASLYTRKADRAKLAREAIGKLAKDGK